MTSAERGRHLGGVRHTLDTREQRACLWVVEFEIDQPLLDRVYGIARVVLVAVCLEKIYQQQLDLLPLKQRGRRTSMQRLNGGAQIRSAQGTSGQHKGFTTTRFGAALDV